MILLPQLRRASRRAGMVGAAITIGLATAACSSNPPQARTADLGECDPSAVDTGISDTEIHLGTTMPLSGTTGTGGKQVKLGQDAYFDKVNAEGGIDGRTIKYTVLDDAYDPSTAQSKMRQLVNQEEIFAVSGGYGTPNFLATVPFLSQQFVPAVAPYAPSGELGSMDTPLVFMATVDYSKEFENLAEYVQENDQPNKIAFVGIAGSLFQDGTAGLDRVFGDTDVETEYIEVDSGTTNFAPIASQLARFDADYLFMDLTSGDTGTLLTAMQRASYSPKLAAWAGMSDETYIEEFGADSEGMLVALETDPMDSGTPGIETFKAEFLEQTGQEANSLNSLGWSNAVLVVEALKRSEGLSRACLVDALESMENIETGIVPPVTWGPDDRQGVQAVGIGRITDGRLEVLTEPTELS